uniref:Methylenetetrahydrofolate dehydrogenase (NADP+ dependent) 2 like n=1 Tax=Ficedula albicollis TaxID=59894 RepID=A0A803VL09_FICAL
MRKSPRRAPRSWRRCEGRCWRCSREEGEGECEGEGEGWPSPPRRPAGSSSAGQEEEKSPVVAAAMAVGPLGERSPSKGRGEEPGQAARPSDEATVISGTKLAHQVLKEVHRDVESWTSAGNQRPHLTVVLVGDNPASHIYVRNKIKAAAAVGISSEIILRPKDISQEELLDMTVKLNRDSRVSGLLVQLPLPGDATVTITHRYTPKEQLKIHTQLADIVIVAAGIPKLITADMVKEGAAVIDVGINHIHDPLTGKTKLVGDVDFEEVKKKAAFITPVPGGVGPMTVAMLLKNTLLVTKKLIY